jgi:hypothetical protein
VSTDAPGVLATPPKAGRLACRDVIPLRGSVVMSTEGRSQDPPTLLRALVLLGRISLVPARAGYHGVGAGVELERARRSLADAGGRAALAGLDAVLSSPYLEEAVDRVLTRALAGDALERVLDRPEVAGVPERVVDRLLAQGVAEQAARRIVNGPELERMVELALESERVRAVLTDALEREGAERMLEYVLESPGAERLVARVIESRLVEEAVMQLVDETAPRLPQSQAVWTLIDEVAQSPAVIDAISQQSKGMAEQFAGEVRKSARKGDDRLERAARRLLRRGRAAGDPPDSAAPEAAT